jgi:hypothetical protein
MAFGSTSLDEESKATKTAPPVAKARIGGRDRKLMPAVQPHWHIPYLLVVASCRSKGDKGCRARIQMELHFLSGGASHSFLAIVEILDRAFQSRSAIIGLAPYIY